MTIKMMSVVGARPNFMKVAAICNAVKEHNQVSGVPIEHVLVHTGQHYDTNMSDFFFNDLELPKPDIFLDVGSASHSVQTARVMERFEAVVLEQRPDVVLVVGDVNSTVACALVTKKGYGAAPDGSVPKLAHVEAGLRSFDRLMPEEINRIVTDAISDYLFTTEASANRNLLNEGIPQEKIHFVGNVMIDTLLRHREKARESTILSDLQLVNGSGTRPFAILTLHRPSNVDDDENLARLLKAFLEISKHIPIVFPAHPRTLKRIQESDFSDYFIDYFMDGPDPWDSRVRIRLIPPLGYLDFLRLMSEAKVVLTDSGGIQEETTILGVPCITLRENTERPVTVEQGTNTLVGSDPKKILPAFEAVRCSRKKANTTPPLWDGRAAGRIVEILSKDLAKGRHVSKPARSSKPAESTASLS